MARAGGGEGTEQPPAFSPAGDPAHPGTLAARACRAFLVSCLVMLVVTVPLLSPTTGTWWVLASSITVAAAGWATSLSPLWRRAQPHPHGVLAVPAWLFISVGALAITSPEAGVAYVGAYVVGFAVIGVLGPRHSGWWMLPVAGLAYLPTLPQWSPAVAVRMLLVGGAWIVLAELLSTLMANQRHTQHELYEQGHLDALTEFPNRRAINERLPALTDRDSVGMCDLDDFKTVNDTLGHAAGDVRLYEFARFLTITLRARDFVARWGGEEFLIIWPDTVPNDAAAALDRLRVHWALLGQGTFSAGVVRASRRNPSDTIARADHMLYSAKRAGKNQVLHPP